jgi:hypothetical protein
VDGQEAFKKISKKEEREKLLHDLAVAHGEILCKGQSDFILKLRTFKLEKDRLRCQILPESGRLQVTQENLIASFNLGGDKYFFQAVGHLEGGEIVFNAAFELFHLQRRQNYRVKIPESYKAHLDIVSINGQQAKMVGTLYDVSSGGCRAAYKKNSSLIKIDDVLEALIYIGRREPLQVTALVRHAKPDPQDKDTQIFGLEFKPLSPALENRMFGITMDLHRELFSKIG